MFCAVIYAEIQRDVPTTTLAAWEEVEAKMKSNGIMTTANSATMTAAGATAGQRTQNMSVEDDDDEFAALSQQFHRSVTSAVPPLGSDLAAASNGGKLHLSVCS